MSRLSLIQAKSRRGQRGSTLVESTLCFLGFMILVIGLMEFAMAVYAFNFVSFAARDAARYASARGAVNDAPVSADQVRTYVRGQAVALVASNVTVNTTWLNGSNAPGSQVTVVVSYPVVPMVGLALRNGFTVSSTSRYTIGD